MTTTKTANRPVTFDHLTKKKAATGTVYVPLNPTALDDVTRASEDVNIARAIGDLDRVARAEAKLEGALTVFRSPENSVRVDFRALGRNRFDGLKKTYPPTEEQINEAKEANQQKPSWDPEAFLAPLISATVTSPEMTVEQVRSLTASEADGGFGWNEGEISTLFNKAVEVNLAGNIGDYSF